MTFSKAVASAFSKYATFSGRARRSEFWYFYLFILLVELIFTFLITLITILGDSRVSNLLFNLLFGIYSIFNLAVLVPSLALTWRRLHDTGHSGGYYFLGLIPLVGGIILLVWFCTDGQRGPNRYGPDPKGDPGFFWTGNQRPPWEY